jgi:Cdc6-like AAA superfamily ATPase
MGEQEEEKKENVEGKLNFKFNPFNDSGITNYDQYKLYPFLVFGTSEIIKTRLQQQINQVRKNFFYSERLIIIGEKGIGKTSILFFAKDMLEKNNVQVVLLSKLMEDEQHFEALVLASKNYDVGLLASKGVSAGRVVGSIGSMTCDKPLYILIDFPDTLEIKRYKKFLDFLWTLMTHKNYNKINFIFAMNDSHFSKSFALSEIFGKFTTIRMEKLKYPEMKELIESRLKLTEETIDNVFETDVLQTIHTYSKGIPRNIISACSLLVDVCNKEKITKKISEKVLKDRYFDQVINDRVEDLELRRIYKQMINLLKDEFDGTAKCQEDYIIKVRENTGLGRNSIMDRISELVKFGIFNQFRGGYNRINKILSLGEEE